MKKRQAFTLLELVVVLVIIGVLATLVSVHITGTLDEAQQTRIDADLTMLVNSLPSAIRMILLPLSVTWLPPVCWPRQWKVRFRAIHMTFMRRRARSRQH